MPAVFGQTLFFICQRDKQAPQVTNNCFFAFEFQINLVWDPPVNISKHDILR